MMISITLGRTSLVAVQAKSLRSHALYLVIKGIHVLSALCVPGFRRIGLTQFFQRFFDREFGCFGHGNLISKRNAFSLLATSQGAGDQQNGRDGIKPSQPIAKLACSASDPA
jgi:hypothetical protein